MRKFIAGFICGAVLLFGTSVLAESVTMVGKTIQSEIPVYLNGENLAVNAIAVDGASYLPVRVIASTLGAKVDFRGGVIHLEKSNEADALKEEILAEIRLENQKSEIRKEIDKLRAAIDNNNRQIQHFEELIANEPDTLIKETYEKNIGMIEQVIQQQTQKIADLEAQLAALEQQPNEPEEGPGDESEDGTEE